jgi:peptidoglycan-associated lipoprotein
MRRSFRALVLSAFAIGCGSDPVPEAKAPEPPPPEPAMARAPAPPPPDAPPPTSINISDEIRRACGITETEAHFAYDSANVRPQDRAILKKLADCFTTGPLKGREMRLVGHADPRGDDDYNMALGGRRSDSIKQAIVGEGMTAGKVATTTRGEMDATGTEESGWARDRRVDITLGN